jgi:hypothetical protein
MAIARTSTQQDMNTMQRAASPDPEEEELDTEITSIRAESQ